MAYSELFFCGIGYILIGVFLNIPYVKKWVIRNWNFTGREIHYDENIFLFLSNFLIILGVTCLLMGYLFFY